jgi:hypothetical protein
MHTRSTKGKLFVTAIILVLLSTGAAAAAIRIRRVSEAASCPLVLQDPITTLVELDANDYIGDNIIDCSTVDIHIQSGGTLRILPYYIDDDQHTDDHGLVIQANSFTVDEGGTIDLEGQGYGPGQQASHIGSGKTSDTPETCDGGVCGGSGGGHGGAGGRGDPDGTNEAGDPGQPYGNRESPVTLGSGGGESGQGIAGGAGGGALKLEIGGTFTLNGIVKADGKLGSEGIDTGGGGGAGGSFWVEAGGFAGSGTATADGGDGGVPFIDGGTGGGGGGGRIVMRCTTSNTFTGSVSVDPGIGNSNDGQVGTEIEPSCYPPAPTGLEQYASWVTNQMRYYELLEDSEGTEHVDFEFRFYVSDIESSSVLTPQLELREVGQDFTGTPTHLGNNVTYSGTPVQAKMLLTGLTQLKDYK